MKTKVNLTQLKRKLQEAGHLVSIPRTRWNGQKCYRVDGILLTEFEMRLGFYYIENRVWEENIIRLYN